jgi:hypothetical protein
VLHVFVLGARSIHKTRLMQCGQEAVNSTGITRVTRLAVDEVVEVLVRAVAQWMPLRSQRSSSSETERNIVVCKKSMATLDL